MAASSSPTTSCPAADGVAPMDVDGPPVRKHDETPEPDTSIWGTEASQLIAAFATLTTSANGEDGQQQTRNLATRHIQTLSLCRRCKKEFVVARNTDRGACRYHTEEYSQETAQRWLEPGTSENGSRCESFWTCCGQKSYDAPGCHSDLHRSYDDPD